MARKARRDRKKETFWRRMVRGQARSRVAVRAWCLEHDLREPTFYWWRAELARRDAAVPQTVARMTRRSRPAFVPIRVAEEASTISNGSIEIVLGRRGDRVRLSGSVDRSLLAEVLAALEAPVRHGGSATC